MGLMLMMMAISIQPVVLETMKGLGFRDVKEWQEEEANREVQQRSLFARSPRIPHDGSAAQPRRQGHL